MSTRRVALALALALLGAIAAPSHAFDGSRKGFILGGGLGPGFSSYTQKAEAAGYPDVESDRESKAGLATDFRIGFGATEQLLLFYDNRVNWFSFDNALGSSVTIADGLSSAAVSYYFEPEAPSLFVTGGAGAAAWQAPFENDSGGMIGFGLFAGGGYEFTKLLNVEGTVSFGSPSDEAGGLKVTTKSMGVRVTLNVLGY